jgi:hypothetical protein
MRTYITRTGSALALTAGLLAGCQSSARRSPYADNPLLQTRPPLQQTNAGNDRLNQIAQAGPRTVVPPPGMAGSPTTYQSAALTAPATTAPSQPPVYATTTTYTSPPMPDAGPAMPDPVAAAPAAPPMPDPLPAQAPTPEPIATTAAVAPDPLMPPAPPPTMSALAAPPAAAPPTIAPVRQVNGRFGHAGDYTWLQGELDKHYRGYLDLRYQSPSEEDAFGGKVRLEGDPRLGEFQAGDVVAVEGELIRDAEGGSQAWGQYPRYRIRSIRLIERK